MFTLKRNWVLGSTILGLALGLAYSVSAQTFLTKDQALELVLGKDCNYIHDPRQITEQISTQLEDLGLHSSDQETAQFFKCEVSGKITGYALIDSEIGKHMPITYIVGISPDGKVTRVEMMVFRERIGAEPRKPDFMQQFEGKTKLDEIRIGHEIKNVTGATYSSRSITKGVQRALLLWQSFYGDQL